MQHGGDRRSRDSEPAQVPGCGCSRQTVTSAAVKPIETVTDVSYACDEGGIMCHIKPSNADSMVVVSLTHVRVPRTLPFAAAALAYQKHRVKKLKKQY
jgi:hypothetical protein